MADGRRRCASCRATFNTTGRAYRLTGYWRARLLEFFALGVPAYRLRHRLKDKLSPPTVQRFFLRLRTAIYRATMRELLPLSGTLELDESVYGGKHHGGRGWAAPGKTFVFGIYKRNGTVRVFPVPDRKHATLQALIAQHTTPGSLYFTDDYHGYASLALRGEHVVVKKEKGRPLGRDHVNGIEGFWSWAKNWLYQYRGVPKDKFPLYLKECEWRFNHRNEDLVPLLKSLLKGQKI